MKKKVLRSNPLNWTTADRKRLIRGLIKFSNTTSFIGVSNIVGIPHGYQIKRYIERLKSKINRTEDEDAIIELDS